MMKTLGIITAALLTTLVIPFLLMSQENERDDWVYVKKWISNDCEVGEEGELAKLIKDQGSRLQPLFIEAFEKGPDAESLEVQSAYYKRMYKARERITQKDRPEVYNSEWKGAASKESEAAYVEKRIGHFITGYKANAISGLGLVADENGKEYLRGLLKDRESEFYFDVSGALEGNED